MQFKRNHSESYFYKYTKASTARLILKEGNFIAQSPLKFSDPFDVQVGMHFGFDIQRFPELFYAKLMSLIEAEVEPNFENRNTISTFVLRLREAHKAGILSKEKLLKETKETVAAIGSILEENRLQFIKTREALVKRMRVLCLSQTHESVLMWSHYAEDHAGVVIKLKVAETEAEDDPLWLAEKVIYTPKAIPLMTEDEALEEVFGIKKYNVEKLSSQLACTKFNVWKDEQEWRFYDVVQEGNDANYTIGINLKRFVAIYFGIRTSDKDVAEIRELALQKNSNIEFYRARKHSSEYKLEFTRI